MARSRGFTLVEVSLGQARYVVAGSPLGEVRAHVSP
jgi:hypothetical protein